MSSMARRILMVAGLATAFDLLSKGLVRLFNVFHVYNVGVYRLGIHETYLMVIAVVCCVGMMWVAVHPKVPDISLPVGLMIGGALGNTISRAFPPAGVLDFIPVYPFVYANVADFFILIGILWIWAALARAAINERLS
jgi:lipoprotein signal peptidase